MVRSRLPAQHCWRRGSCRVYSRSPYSPARVRWIPCDAEVPVDDRRPITYGEFPKLFRGFPLDEPVDLDSAQTMLALVSRADDAVKDRLLDRERLRAYLESFMAREESWALLGRIDDRDTPRPTPTSDCSDSASHA